MFLMFESLVDFKMEIELKGWIKNIRVRIKDGGVEINCLRLVRVNPEA